MTLFAVSGDTYWAIALIVGLVAALVVVVLLALLLQYIGRIRRSVDGLLEVAGKVGANTANIPQLEATAPVLALIVEEAVVVESGHLQPLEGAVKAINAQFDVILGALPGIGRKAAIVAERRPK